MGARLDRGADGVQVLHQTEVEGQRGGAGRAEEVQRRALGAAVHHDGHGQPADQLASCSSTRWPRPPAACRSRSPWAGRPAARPAPRLVELDEDLGARHPGGDVGDVGGDPLGEGLREVPAGTGSTTARSPRVRSSPAASVHGPATWTFNGPV